MYRFFLYAQSKCIMSLLCRLLQLLKLYSIRIEIIFTSSGEDMKTSQVHNCLFFQQIWIFHLKKMIENNLHIWHVWMHKTIINVVRFFKAAVKNEFALEISIKNKMFSSILRKGQQNPIFAIYLNISTICRCCYLTLNLSSLCYRYSNYWVHILYFW